MIISSLHRFPSENGACLLRIFVMLVAGALICRPSNGEEEDAAISADSVSSNLPEPVTETNFSALKSNSPFRRRLDFSESMALTGIANVNGDLIATLIDRETKETHVVSSSANAEGWQIVGIDGDQTGLESVTAKISIVGGEVFSVSFDESQIKPEPRRLPEMSSEQAKWVADQAKNYRRGISGDGFRGPPPPEMVEKLSKLSEVQRKRLIFEMGEMRRRGVSSEERRGIFVRKVDQALRERR